MANMDMHEVHFEWPQTDPKTVIVTGTFDQWSSTRKLTKTATGFVGSVKIPWNEKISYKYIVDGNWALAYGTPIETERRTGFVNHVYFAPPKPQVPVVLPTSEPEPVIADTTGAAEKTAKAPENTDNDVDIPTKSSLASGAVNGVSPVLEDSGNEVTESSVAPIPAEAMNDSHTKSGAPAHVDVGESSIADAKSDSGTTAVADLEPTADDMTVPLEPVPSPKSSPGKERELETTEKKTNNRPSPLPATSTKGEAFPSVSPPSSPSRFSSFRGIGKKRRTPSFFAKLKEAFKSDKEKDHSGKAKAATESSN